MDLDDFDDLENDKPTQLLSRVSEFLPKSSTNKAFPKPEPPRPRPQQQSDASVLKKPKKEDDLNPTTTNLSPKTEPSASNGAVKTEMKPVPEVEMNPINDEPVESNRIRIKRRRRSDCSLNRCVLHSYSRCRNSKVRVKPASTEVEIDLSIDVDSNNWNSERASSANITKQTLKSSWKPPPTTGYTVGVLDGNKGPPFINSVR